MRVLGIRHHGPGSARAVREELARLAPDLVLIEGPPEADALVEHARHAEPPVALLAHAPGVPAAFWPFAVFSPEWQAILYGLRAGVPVRFCDLPAAHTLAGVRFSMSRDPIGELAQAAGYDDAERWWEDAVEHRGDTPFNAIAEAMSALREPVEPDPREAHMRKVIRAARKDGFERIAVICGAWHVPALLDPFPSAQSDNDLLRGLPKVKAELAWVPWTYGRLASAGGYGAGVESPGWYHHLYTVRDRPVERWLADAAAVLRGEGLAVSSAHVIEAVRLAHALAALRGRPLAGLGEVTEAARAVLCEGDDLPLDLIQRRMVVGERLGSVGEGTPMAPLQRDLRDQQRRLRLRPDVAALDLDLRKPLDLERSHLLHRLRLLGVPWGSPGETRGKGTFKESWTLQWRPEYDLTLIESAPLGATIREAAANRARGAGGSGPGGSGGSGGAALAELAGLVEQCLLAHLPEALPDVLAALSDRAALDTDVAHLMAALPAIARAHRYGDVRGTPAEGLAAIAESLLDRIRAGLPVAAAGVDHDAAAALLRHLDGVHSAVALLAEDDPETRPRWLATLRALCDRPGLHGLIAGRLTRILLDSGSLDDAADRVSRALSRGNTPARVAAWVEGFLSGGGLLLVHDPRLLSLVDTWLTGLSAEQFTEVLPLLRRTFSGFSAPERRAVGERVRGGQRQEEGAVDAARAAAAVRTVEGILHG